MIFTLYALDFLNKDPLEMIFIITIELKKIIFTIKMNWKRCIGNDFFYRYGLDIILTIKMHWKLFLQ